MFLGEFSVSNWEVFLIINNSYGFLGYSLVIVTILKPFS